MSKTHLLVMPVSLDVIKNIPIAEFDYPLPDGRIARHPLPVRDSCRLLVAGPEGVVKHSVFSKLPDFLPAGSLLVCNDTRVINARIRFRKTTGAEIEVFLLEPISPADYVLMFQSRSACRWACLVGNLKRWKTGALEKRIEVDGAPVTLRASRGETMPGNAREILFEWDVERLTFASIVEAAGFIPIPPYLGRESEESDADDYQTLYARISGSVAAPTAGLHFTERLFDALASKDIRMLPVTLHVGAGTFQPVKSEEIGDHPMHTEVFSVSRELVEGLCESLRAGTTVTAVGTTSVRTLESLPLLGKGLLDGDRSLRVGQWDAYSPEAGLNSKEDTINSLKAILDYMDEAGVPQLTASTSIMIAPGFRWRVVDRMVTNFHQPQSTLLLLVGSFLGYDPATGAGAGRWREIYAEALAEGYRFLSYGDACLFSRELQV